MYLFLERLRCSVEPILPADQFDPHDALECAVEAIRYDDQPVALGSHIDRRGDEQSNVEFAHGSDNF